MSTFTYITPVKPEWIDYNGHMSEAFYVLVFGFATDRTMDALGLDSAYRASSECSLYTVEAHVRYLHEAGLGDQLHVMTEVVGVTEKKLHLGHTMFVGDDVVATEEILGLHVHQKKGRTVPFPEAVEQRAAAALRDAPWWAGRAVSL